jgi:hypothetical protein
MAGEVWTLVCDGNSAAGLRGASMSVLPIAVAGLPDWRFHTMQGNVKEHWMELCEKATVEQDSEKLMALIQEINRMLEKKEDRLRRKQNAER